MNFACDRCGKRFTSSEEAVPGRTYRIPCDCGNTIVVEVPDPAQATPTSPARYPYTTPPGMYRNTRGAPDPFAPPLAAQAQAPGEGEGEREGEPLSDDPFARAFSRVGGEGESSPPWAEVTPTFAGPFARRDPDAPPEESTEYRITGSFSFDDVLRRVRRQGFLAGAAAGALAGAVVAGVLAVLSASSTPTPTATATPAAVPTPAAPPTAPAPPTPTPTVAPPRAAKAPALPPARPERAPGTVAPAPERVAPEPAEERPSVAAEAEGERVAAARSGAEDLPAGAGDRAPVPGAEPGDEEEPPEPRDAAEPPDPSSPAGAAVEHPVTPPASAKAAASAGRVDEEAVAAAVRGRRGAIDACVAATPGGAAAARGRRFFLRVVVEPSGGVSDAQIDDSEVEATPLGVCLVRLVREMSFASFEGAPVRVELALQYGEAE